MLERVMLLAEEYRIKQGEEALGKKKFLDLVAQFFPRYSDEYKLIKQAFVETGKTLEGRYREGEKPDAALSHPTAVAVLLMVYLGVRDWRWIVAALLHDNIEDYRHEWSVERIAQDYHPDIAIDVWVVSKPLVSGFGGNKQRRDEFFRQQLVRADWSQKVLKLCDRLHNLITIWAKARKKRIQKVEETRVFYIPYLARPLGVFVEELEEACSAALIESDHMED